METKEITQLLINALSDVAVAIETNDAKHIYERIDMLNAEIAHINEIEKKTGEGMTVANINRLRHETGLGLLACKKALYSANGEVDEALRILRSPNVDKILRGII